MYLFTSMAAMWLALMSGEVAESLAPGTPVTRLTAIATSQEASLSNQDNGFVTLATRYKRVVFIPSVRRITLDGIAVYMNGPFESGLDGGHVSTVDAGTVLEPLLQGTSAPPLPSTPPLIVLDPGHGGEDPGAVGINFVTEKDVVLVITKRLRSALVQSGVQVRLTREDDRYLSLGDRISLVRQWRADAFISIHLNSSANHTAGGVETFVLPARGFPSTSNGTNGDGDYPGNRYDAENTRLAFFIQKGLLYQTQGEDRGLRRARYEVLRDAPCPAILAECGFVTNRKEAKLLQQPAYCERVAQGLASGLLTYISRRE